MSALPAQVKKQVERANELAAKLVTPAEPPASEPVPATAAAQPTTAQPPAPVSESTPQPTPPVETFEQKYRVLQGKYNAEIPRLQAQNRDLAGKVTELQGQLTTMQALIASLGDRRPTADSQEPPPAPVKLVKDDEIREFGADLIDVVRRAAKEAVLPEIDQRIDQRVRPVAQKVEQTERAAAAAARKLDKSDEQAVYRLLTERVPNWAELNESDAFNDWLDLADPYTGQKRGKLMLEAFKAHDGPRVVAFFQGYLNEHAAVTPPASTVPAAQGATPARLEDMVVPGAPKAGAAGAQEGAGKRIWSGAEIKQFYRDVQAGKFRSNPERQKQLEADIFAAQRESRIRA